MPPSSRRLRLRDLPALPLLLLLQLVFTLSSLLLRLYEAITTPPPEEDERASRPQAPPPGHVALLLAPPRPRDEQTRPQAAPRQLDESRRAALESVRRAVRWAAECGVEELSVYDGHGLLQFLLPSIQAELLDLPPSPPSSSPPSPPQSHAWLASPPGTDVEDETPVRRRRALGGKVKTPDTASEGAGDGDARWGEVLSLTVKSREDTMSRPLKLHLIPPASDLIPHITRSLAQSGISPSKITQQLIDARVRDALHAPPPDLLVIHPLRPLSLWESLLPRAAPELGGYPFWSLRITEIYQHPPPLPLHHLDPILHHARRSTLPFIRKLGNLFPHDDVDEGEKGRRDRVVLGALRREEWDGAMGAWAKVDQRLGR